MPARLPLQTLKSELHIMLMFRNLIHTHPSTHTPAPTPENVKTIPSFQVAQEYAVWPGSAHRLQHAGSVLSKRPFLHLKWVLLPSRAGVDFMNFCSPGQSLTIAGV